MAIDPRVLAALAGLPFVVLLAGYPKRVWAASAALFFSAAACVAAAVYSGAPSPQWTGPAWGLLGAALAWRVCWRSAREDERETADLLQFRARRAEIAKVLAQHKARGSAAEREQKETLALYGMIKSLGEALSWDDIRPKLEAAVDQYLGLQSFAFYAAGGKGEADFKLLALRRMEGSPGSSWVTLARHLQERGLTPEQSLVADAPEPAVGLPVVDNGEVLGYFYARLPASQAPSAALGKAQGFTQEIAFAFRRIRLFQEVESLSEIDGLTGVYRRGGFDDRLRQEAVRAKTFKTTFGLMLLDIDHFKQLNDRYGHPFGDQVLRRVGEILNAAVYETDYVARYGGEEFTVLLPRAEPEGAQRKAEAIRRAVEEEKFTMGFETIRVTVSIGIAHFPRDAGTPEELVARADAAMYAAKSQGRNRVVDCRAIRSS